VAGGGGLVGPAQSQTSGRWSRTAALGAGFTVPLLLAWAAFAATGGAHDMLYWLVWRSATYAPARSKRLRRPSAPRVTCLPWLLATAALWWAWFRSRARLDPHRRRLLDGLVVTGLTSAFAGFRFYPHYLIPAGSRWPWARRPRWPSGARARVGEAGRAFLAATLVVVAVFQAVNAWLYLGGIARLSRDRSRVSAGR
jgi:hypothetical protein